MGEQEDLLDRRIPKNLCRILHSRRWTITPYHLSVGHSSDFLLMSTVRMLDKHGMS